MVVAASTDTAATDDKFLAFKRQIAENVVSLTVADDSPGRNFDMQICATQTTPKRNSPRIAAFGAKMLPIGEIAQSVQVGVDDKNDVPSLAAVTTVGAALWDIFFMSEAYLAGAAIAGFDCNFT